MVTSELGVVAGGGGGGDREGRDKWGMLISTNFGKISQPKFVNGLQNSCCKWPKSCKICESFFFLIFLLYGVFTKKCEGESLLKEEVEDSPILRPSSAQAKG